MSETSFGRRDSVRFTRNSTTTTAPRLVRGISESACPPSAVAGGGPADAFRMQTHLLDSPVVHVGHQQLVLGRARDAVNPVELFGTAPRFADPAEDLPVQRHLVDASGLLVGGVEILRRRVGNAERPRLR